MHYFQDLIQKLTQYWASQGCATHFGHDLETGAGTFNPTTFFRSLGPEPYKAAYLEPSRRPTDGRYGDNPSRMQSFLQFQVILKPSPINMQELYLDSLKAIGLDIQKHDIRFVHDDWKSPTLGAWGLGWEVWVDGMEASQFTYFQQFGGMQLEVIPGEITYGLERIAMHLQNVDSAYDLKWNKDLTYGDIYHQNEVQWSTYNFEASNIGYWKTTFDMSEKEALDLVEKKLPIPAYDFVTKASHAFNMLDARGVVSVSERVTYINRIRAISCLVAKLFLAHRKGLGYPLSNSPKMKEESLSLEEIPFDPKDTDDFILEIGLEELPQSFVPIGIKNLKKDLKAFLTKHKLSYSEIETYGSPRRLVAYVKDLSLGTKAESLEKKGPSIDKAFNSSGELSSIGKGLLDSLQIEPCTLKEVLEETISSLRVREVKNAPYLFVTHAKKQKSTRSIFHQELASLILNINFPKKMMWSDLKVPYARPIHSLLALHGKETIPFEVAGVTSSNTSFGHPSLSPGKIIISCPKNYFNSLGKSSVIVDQEEREKQIYAQLKKIEIKMGAQAVHTTQVTNEVLYLCEDPHLIVASFDPKFLELPKDLIELVLVTHQKYFPLESPDGKILEHFVVCLDTKENATIKKGHEKAVSPRLSDGLFLFHQDLKCGLNHFADKLANITFQKKHGSLKDKADRLLKHAQDIHHQLRLPLDAQEIPIAAKYLKADLASHVVFEFPELQGIIGKVYAEHERKPYDVAAAIEEHWLPRFEEDDLPTNAMGIIFSLSDKIDNLLACFLASHIPTSSSDPFALRRQALGVIRILIENKLHLPLKNVFKQSLQTFEIDPQEDVIEPIGHFLISRIKTVLTKYNLSPDEITAVLASNHNELDIYDLFLRAKSLHEFKDHELFNPLLEVYKRAKGQLNVEILSPIDPTLFEQDEEKNLYEYFCELKPQFEDCLQNRLYLESFHLLATLHPLLEKLFENVKILVDDSKLRMSRLSLLSEILNLFNLLFDFSQVVRK